MTSGKILLVDDEADIRDILADLLAGEGFEIVEADSGDVALPLLQEIHPHLLLTDINMPGHLDGIALAQSARMTNPALPVIFITGKPDGVMRAQKLPAPSAVFCKPFALSNLLTMLQHLVGKAQTE